MRWLRDVLIQLGPLRAHVVDSEGEAALTVVLFHGYGAPGTDLVKYASALRAPAGTRFVFPESPHLLDDLVLLNLVDDARVWWSKDARAQQQRFGIDTPRAAQIPETFDPVCADVVTMLDVLGAPAKNLVIGGFSQGAVLALEVALRTGLPFAGLVLLSGALAAGSARMSARRGLPVFQSHGRRDSAISFAAAENLERAMTEAGMQTTFVPFDGGHGIPPEVVDSLARWIPSVVR